MYDAEPVQKKKCTKCRMKRLLSGGKGVAHLGVHHSRQEADHGPVQQAELFVGPVNQPSQGRVHVVRESPAKAIRSGVRRRCSPLKKNRLPTTYVVAPLIEE